VIAGGPFREAGDLLSHHRAHAAAHEAKVHHSNRHRDPFQASQPCQDGILELGALLVGGQALGVGLLVEKVQGIRGSQVFVQGLPGSGIQKLFQPLWSCNAMVMPTARADLPVLLQILGVGQGVTGRTLLPEAIGNFSHLTLFVEGAATCQV
jgi:hypothetical protein